MNEAFTLDPPAAGDPAGTTGRITRSDATTWDSGGFTTGQQISISGEGQTGQFVVTGTTNAGATLLVDGTGVNFAQHQTGVGLTVDIDSPLVIYGNIPRTACGTAATPASSRRTTSAPSRCPTRTT